MKETTTPTGIYNFMDSNIYFAICCLYFAIQIMAEDQSSPNFSISDDCNL